MSSQVFRKNLKKEQFKEDFIFPVNIFHILDNHPVLIMNLICYGMAISIHYFEQAFIPGEVFINQGPPY